MPGSFYLKQTVGRWLRGKPEWLRSYDERVLLVFVHLPKAAGTSINGLFKSVYGGTFLNVGNRRKVWESKHPNPDRILCLSGHFRYGWHRKLGSPDTGATERDGVFAGRDIRYLAVVRDPVERVKSYYRYVQRNKNHRHHKRTQGMNPRQFFAFLESLGDREPWNQQFRAMRGLPDDRFFLVATLPQLEEFVEVLARALRWPPGWSIPHLNRTDTKETDGFDEELTAQIEEWSIDDQRLYKHVGERFESRDFPAFRILGNVDKFK